MATQTLTAHCLHLEWHLIPARTALLLLIPLKNKARSAKLLRWMKDMAARQLRQATASATTTAMLPAWSVSSKEGETSLPPTGMSASPSHRPHRASTRNSKLHHYNTHEYSSKKTDIGTEPMFPREQLGLSQHLSSSHNTSSRYPTLLLAPITTRVLYPLSVPPQHHPATTAWVPITTTKT